MQNHSINRAISEIEVADDSGELRRALDDLFDCGEAYDPSNFSAVLSALHGNVSCDDFDPPLVQRFLQWLERSSTLDSLQRYSPLLSGLLNRAFPIQTSQGEQAVYALDSFFHDHLYVGYTTMEKNRRNLFRGLLCSYQPPTRFAFRNFAWCKYVRFTCPSRFHNLLRVFLAAQCPRETTQQKATWMSAYYQGASALFHIAAQNKIPLLSFLRDFEPAWMLSRRTLQLLRIAAEISDEQAVETVGIYVAFLNPTSQINSEARETILRHILALSEIFKTKNFCRAREKLRNELARLRILNTNPRVGSKYDEIGRRLGLLTQYRRTRVLQYSI